MIRFSNRNPIRSVELVIACNEVNELRSLDWKNDDDDDYDDDDDTMVSMAALIDSKHSSCSSAMDCSCKK